MTDSNQHRRHFTRINFDAECRISTPENKHQYSGHVVDLSLHGILINQPDDFQCECGDILQLELILSAGEISIKMETEVAHIHDGLIGLECKHIDVDSITHLRQILELNLGDPNLVEREIVEMIEVHKH